MSPSFYWCYYSAKKNIYFTALILANADLVHARLNKELKGVELKEKIEEKHEKHIRKLFREDPKK